MANCANCSADALYVYQVTKGFGVNYCQKHLPKFIAKAGTFVNIETVVEESVPEVVKVSKKKPEVKVEVPVVEPEPESAPNEEAPAQDADNS